MQSLNYEYPAMKYTILISILLLASIFAVAQPQDIPDSWKVKLNKKVLLATNHEDEKTNIRKVRRGEWKKNGSLEIAFKEAEPGVWKRFFLFNDEDDNQALRLDSVTYSKISLASLRKLFAGKKEIRIYTTVAPLDPNVAVRIRRIHLCTLRLQ
jgi:hypothetical protein